MMKKKILCFALGMGIGLVVGGMYLNQNNMPLQTVKRKLRKLERDMKKFFEKLSPEQMKKYKDDIETKYNEIKNKIDNLTIKDIKNSASSTLCSIKENISNLSSKLSSLMTSEANS